VRLVIVRPAGATGVLPVFMFFHGAGAGGLVVRWHGHP
jgi:hypothetical protein